MTETADYQGAVSEYPESGVNWEILKELAEKPHPLLNPAAGDLDSLHYSVVEVLYEALNVHHLLDMIGVPQDIALDCRGIDSRTLYAVLGHMKLSERLDRIAGWHQREAGPAGTVGDYCTECGHRWPCDTRRMADGNYADEDAEGPPS